MSRTLRVHFAIPAASAPAPHMTSGPPRRTDVAVLGTGVPHVAACDPKVVQSEWDGMSDMPYATQCAACRATDIWKAANEQIKHPRLTGRPDAPSPEDAGCCD